MELLSPTFEQQKNNILLRRWSRLIALQQWYRAEQELFRESIALPYRNFEKESEHEAWNAKSKAWKKQNYLGYIANKKLPCGICNEMNSMALHHQLKCTKREGTPFMACHSCQEQYLWTRYEAIVLWGYTGAQMLCIPFWLGQVEELAELEGYPIRKDDSASYYCTSDLLEFRKQLPMMRESTEKGDIALEAPVEIEITENLWHRSKNLPPEMRDYVTFHYREEKSKEIIESEASSSLLDKVVVKLLEAAIGFESVTLEKPAKIRYFINYHSNKSRLENVSEPSIAQKQRHGKQQSTLSTPSIESYEIQKQFLKFPARGIFWHSGRIYPPQERPYSIERTFWHSTQYTYGLGFGIIGKVCFYHKGRRTTSQAAF